MSLELIGARSRHGAGINHFRSPFHRRSGSLTHTGTQIIGGRARRVDQRHDDDDDDDTRRDCSAQERRRKQQKGARSGQRPHAQCRREARGSRRGAEVREDSPNTFVCCGCRASAVGATTVPARRFFPAWETRLSQQRSPRASATERSSTLRLCHWHRPPPLSLLIRPLYPALHPSLTRPSASRASPESADSAAAAAWCWLHSTRSELHSTHRCNRVEKHSSVSRRKQAKLK